MYLRISLARLVNATLTAALCLSALAALIPFQAAEAATKAPVAKVTKKIVAVAKPAVKAKASAKKAAAKKTVKKVASKTSKSKKGNGTSRLLGNELIDPNNPPGGR